MIETNHTEQNRSVKTLYLIPGTGADHRFFSRLKLDYPSKVIEWEEWGSAKSIRDYAAILSRQINKNEPFAIIGVSFGGMLAVEMASFLPVENVIIISSAKSYKELPKVVRFLGVIGARYLIAPKLIRKLPFAARFFGVSKKEKVFFEKMLSETSDVHLKRTIKSILAWKTVTYNKSIVHIHGTNDQVIPVSNLNNVIPIKNGGHFMVYNKASIVSEEINKVLTKK